MSSAQTSSNMYRVQACWRRGSCLTGGLSKKRRTGSGFCVGAARTEVNNTVLESSAKSPNCYIEFTRCGRASNQLQAKRTGRQRRKGRAVDDIFIREQSAQRNLPILLSRSDRWSVLPMELGRTQYIFSHWEETLYSQRGGV